jgi:autotransporter-associated beta strand protein
MKPTSAHRLVRSGSRAAYLLAVSIAALLASGPARAADNLTWNGAATDDWSTSDTLLNWLNGSAGCYWANGNNAIFGGATASAITLTTPITANKLTFNTNGYTIAGTPTNNLTLSGHIRVESGFTATISAPVTFTQGWQEKSGTGTLILAGAASTSGDGATGEFGIVEGTLRTGNANVLGGLYNLRVQNGSTLDLAGNDDGVRRIWIYDGGTVATGAGTLTFTDADGSNSLESGGYGATSISGHLDLGGGMRKFYGGDSINPLAISAAIAGDSASGINVVGGNRVTAISGAISGDCSIQVNEGSYLSLSGNNSYTGTTTVNGNGVLIAAAPASLPGYNTTDKVTVASGSTLAVGYGATGDWTLPQITTLLSGTNIAAGAILGFDTTNAIDNSASYTPAAGDGRTLAKYGANTLTVNGDNTWPGLWQWNGAKSDYSYVATRVYGGTLVLTGDNRAATSDTMVTNATLSVTTANSLPSGFISLGGDSSTLKLLNDSSTVFNPASAVAIAGNGEEGLGNWKIFVDRAHGGSGVGQNHTLSKVTVGGNQYLTVDGDHGYSLTIDTYEGGMNKIGALVDLTINQLNQNSYFTLVDVASGVNVTVKNGEFNNHQLLMERGTGTMTVTGTISHASLVSVDAGRLIFNGTLPNDASGQMNIRGNGILSGTGTINVPVNVGGSATIAPGDRSLVTPAKGTLTLQNALTLGDSTTTDIRLFSTTDSDKLVQSNLTETITFGGTLNVSQASNFSGTLAADNSWDLFDWTVTPTGTFSTLNLPELSGLTWNTDNLYSDGIISLDVALTPVPQLAISTPANTRVLAGAGKTITGTYGNSGGGTVTATLTDNGGSLTVASFNPPGSQVVGAGSTGLQFTGSISNVGEVGAGKTFSVAFDTATASGTLDVVNQRSFDVGTTTIALGTIHAGATPTGSTVITSSGDHTVTGDASLGSFTPSSTQGLSLTTTDATAFLGAASSQTATYNLSGVITAGILGSASFTSIVAAELDSISNVVVDVTGSAFSGNGKWTSPSSGNWGTGENTNWTDSNGIQAAPGTFAGFGGVDTATFDGTGAGTVISLNGVSPSVKNVAFSGSVGYTIDGTGGDTLTLKADTGSATLSSSSTAAQLISAPLQLASNSMVDVTGSGRLTVSGNIGESASHSLTKSGDGILELTGTTNNYSGGTSVSTGTLLVNNTSGTGAGTAALSVASGGTLGGSGIIGAASTIQGIYAPGNPAVNDGIGIQTFSNGLTYATGSHLQWQLNGNVSTDSIVYPGIRGTTFDGVNVTTGGAFAIAANATLDLSFGGAVDFTNIFWDTAHTWTIADLDLGVDDSNSGVFKVTPVVAGTNNYSPADGSFKVTRVTDPINGKKDVVLNWNLGTPFQLWMLEFDFSAYPGADTTETGDADKDGVTNLNEFAFAGDPADPKNKGLVYGFTADSDAASDPTTAKELILTVAVRAGAAFSAAGAQGAVSTATVDGLDYAIQGSANLTSWDVAVTPVTQLTPPAGLPALPANYQYVSFSLNGSDGLAGKGFLRAQATQP